MFLECLYRRSNGFRDVNFNVELFCYDHLDVHISLSIALETSNMSYIDTPYLKGHMDQTTLKSTIGITLQGQNLSPFLIL